MPETYSAGSPVVEIIEDSEPEREECRNRRKEEPRKKRKQANTIAVIELTDSDSCNSDTSDILLSPLVANIDAGRRQIHGETVITAGRPVLALPDGTARKTATTSTQLLDTVKTSTVTIPDTRTQTETVDGSDESDVDERTVRMRTKLGSFTFAQSSQTSSVANSSANTSQQKKHAIEPPKGTPSRQACSKMAALYLDFSERQLNSLLKCVSCDLKWTIRKSAANKVSHMRTCANKARITEETMKVLISRDIKAYLKKTELINDCHEEPPPKTYLEHVIKENISPRPAKRRKEPVCTVKAISELRVGIRDRARAVLSRRSSGKIPGRDKQVELPSPTRTFEQSKPGFQTALTSNSDDEAGPPLTQPLPCSKLGTATRSNGTCARTLDLIAEPPSPDPPEAQLPDYLKLPSAKRSRIMLSNTDSVADVVSSCHTFSVTPPSFSLNYNDAICDGSDCYSYDSDDNNDANDNAILVFDPATRDPGETYEEDDEYHADEACQSPTKTPIRSKESRIIYASDRIPVNVIAATANLDLDGSSNEPLMCETPSSCRRRTRQTTSPKKTKGNKYQSKDANDVVVDDEKLFEKFMSMILEDEALYLRVLCYEPIRLDVFINLAREHVREYDLGSLGLKIKLKAFLDRQAIHYCEPGGWGRR